MKKTVKGSFYTVTLTGGTEFGNNFSGGIYGFDADIDTGSYGNPMSGHANGVEIKPTSISFLFLIAY